MTVHENEIVNDEEIGREEIEYSHNGISASFLINCAEGCRDWCAPFGVACIFLTFVLLEEPLYVLEPHKK